MLVSLAWRNLGRNLRRSLLTGGAVAFGLFLIVWMRGLQDGSYTQMIDQAARSRLGHLQVLAEGYLDQPEPRLVVPEAGAVVLRLEAVEHVAAVSARAVSEGVVARDNESAQVELLGVEPAAEARVSDVPGEVIRGEAAVRFCREKLAEGLDVMGGDEALFERWCAAMGTGEFLPEGEERAVVLGSGLAEQLLVSVGDEVTVQVVRAVAGEGPGEERGALSQRRLRVAGVVRTGNPEVDDRAAYVQIGTLTQMLGTGGPNEVVAMLDDIRRLDVVKAAAARELGDVRGARVYTWAERNPALQSLISLDSESGNLMYVILFLLVALGVVNATFMSILERTKELGVMLALGTRRLAVFALVMTEVALLGLVSVAAGGLLGAAIEVFGRTHGWPIEWFGADMSGTAMSGVVYESVYYAGLRPDNAVVIVVGVYVTFLLAGLWPAIRAALLQPVKAMRTR